MQDHGVKFHRDRLVDHVHLRVADIPSHKASHSYLVEMNRVYSEFNIFHHCITLPSTPLSLAKMSIDGNVCLLYSSHSHTFEQLHQLVQCCFLAMFLLNVVAIAPELQYQGCVTKILE